MALGDAPVLLWRSSFQSHSFITASQSFFDHHILLPSLIVEYSLLAFSQSSFRQHVAAVGVCSFSSVRRQWLRHSSPRSRSSVHSCHRKAGQHFQQRSSTVECGATSDFGPCARCLRCSIDRPPFWSTLPWQSDVLPRWPAQYA